jgi:hypothetical protein
MGRDPAKTGVHRVRCAGLEDAVGVAVELGAVIAEGFYTTLAGHWTPEEVLMKADFGSRET